MKTANPNVQYENNCLVIRVPTKSPAALHEALMKGITAGIRSALEDANTNAQEAFYLRSLMGLLDVLMPQEEALDASYGRERAA